jgi:hypothetical protein
VTGTVLAVLVLMVATTCMVVFIKGPGRRTSFADGIDREDAARLWQWSLRAARQLERINSADALMPSLSDKDRQENERLIKAFYGDQLSKGE